MGQPARNTEPPNAPEPSASLQLALLGPLSISKHGSKLELSGPKRRALLILLALSAGIPVGRDRIVDALWPKRLTGREESTLRVHISHLRDKLELARDGAPRVLVTRGSAYMLASENVELDVTRFFQLTNDARALLPTQAEAALQLLNEALYLWRGRPLQDVEYEEFAQETILRLELARVEAIEDRAEALVELGEDFAAIEDLEALVRVDATRERPVLLLMRALYRTGRHADSLRVARRHARQLAEQGLEPSPRVGLLEERILRHDPALLPQGTVSPSDVRPGRSVRGYELREESGTGSIGVVYRAFQPSVGREVAVKAIHPRLAQAPEFVRRFAEEARVVAGLEHPHIVPLHDFWRDPAGAFLVMRWMDGGSLEERIGLPWSEDDLVRVFGQLSEALEYAHSAGVVHRDVKPANVLFDASGNAYLCDFGLAVTAIDTGLEREGRPTTLEPPYASPELILGEGPTVASDVFGLGVLLAETASGVRYRGADTPVSGAISEVVAVATAANPADRYPDMPAFRSALRDALGSTTTMAAPRQVRRNPYKGLAPFDEGDRADFYGRDDVIETLIDAVGTHGLTAVIGASGSGKSSLVMAGLVPQLRGGGLPGSEEWSIVSMVPGTDPFDEFHHGLRAAAVGPPAATPGDRSREMRHEFAAALEGPNSRALLIVDQFEELFSSEIDEATRAQFLDNLVDLAVDPAHRVRVVLTLRADFSDQPLAHPRFGDLISKASVLLAPMPPEQVEDVIRRPAARVGVQVEPGLIAEIVRDIASAPAYLPLLQYVLSELFERRSEDRLAVSTYRALGGVQGVLERRAEATYSSLEPGAQRACRQLFLRMVYLGEHAEETRRRLPLDELHGLRRRIEIDEALEAFSAARLLTYDRDPVSRTPTVEVAHETVIRRWTRYRMWIDEARADVLVHQRLSAAAVSWVEADENPAYLLTGGPLATALDAISSGRVEPNEREARFVSESHDKEEALRQADEERRRREETVEHRARRRLMGGIGAAAIAVVIGVLAVFALAQTQRANDLASAQERQSSARGLAAASVGSLSVDPELSLLLALEAAELSLEAEEPIIPEVVDALHRAIIAPKPALVIDGAGFGPGAQLVDYSPDGSSLVMLGVGGGAVIVDTRTGDELGRIDPLSPTAFGVAFHPQGGQVLTIHTDAVRQWDWRSGELVSQINHGGAASISTAAYSRDGSLIAIGGSDGVIRVWDAATGEQLTELVGHSGNVTTVDFDPTGTRLVSGATDNSALVWDIGTGEIITRSRVAIILPVLQVAWHPFLDLVAITTVQGAAAVFDAVTGERISSFSGGQSRNVSIGFDRTGSLVIGAAEDGIARIFGTLTAGEPAASLAGHDGPLGDAAFDPSRLGSVATIGADGTLRIWPSYLGSELPARLELTTSPRLAATSDGSRYVYNAHGLRFGAAADEGTSMVVVDAASGQTLIRRPTIADGLSHGANITPDGQLAAFVGVSGDVELIEIETGRVRAIPESSRWTTSLSFSSDGTLLGGSSFDGSIAVWEVATGDILRVLRGHGDRSPANGGVPTEFSESLGVLNLFTVFRVNGLEFRPNTTVLASVGYDGTVRIWDIATGEGQILGEFRSRVSSLAYSADGSLLAVADNSGVIRVWDTDTDEIVTTPESVAGGILAMAFSPDGRWLAGAGPGPLARLWDMKTGGITRRFEGAFFGATDVVFVNGGTELRVAAGEGVDRGYALDPGKLVDVARSQVTRDLTEGECERYLRRSCDA